MGPRTSPNDKGPQKTQENSSLWSPFLSCFCSTQWNKIEHRMFCHITQNWRATPLTSRLAVVEPIANTTTKTGLTIRCELDTNTYPKGIKVSEEQMAALNLKGDEFHPDWNYSISPRGQIVEP